MRCPNVAYYMFNAPMEGFPWDDLRKILHEGQRIAKVQNSEEILQNYCIRISFLLMNSLDWSIELQ